MTVAITAEQRDALYDVLLDRISGVGDVWIAVCTEDYEAASRLALAYADDLRFVVEDLGWGDTAPTDPIELKTPPEVLQRVLGRLRSIALGLSASEERERSELRESQRQNQVVLEACDQVLAGVSSSAL